MYLEHAVYKTLVTLASVMFLMVSRGLVWREMNVSFILCVDFGNLCLLVRSML